MSKEKFSFSELHEPTPPMLINEVSRMFFRIVKQRSGGSDKRPTREQHSARLMLMHLSRCGSATQSELVKVTGMKAPTISVALRNMENQGLVVREADAGDGRISHVSITEKGRQVDRDNLQRILEVDAVMMDGVTEAEAKAMMSTLCKMRENLAKELKNTHEAD